MTDEQLRDKIFGTLEGNEVQYIGGLVIGKNDQLMKELWAIAKFYAKRLDKAMTTDELLTKLPARVQIQENIAWLTLNKHDSGFQAGYLHGDGVYEKKLSFTAPTAHEALEMLADSEFLSGALSEHDGSKQASSERAGL